jgi:hypothetical protein
MTAAAVQVETPAGADAAPAAPAGGGRVRSGATGSRAESARRYPAGMPGAKGRRRWAARSRAAASSTDALQLRRGAMAGGVALAGKAGPGRASDTAGRQLVRSDRRSWPAVGTATSPWGGQAPPHTSPGRPEVCQCCVPTAARSWAAAPRGRCGRGRRRPAPGEYPLGALRAEGAAPRSRHAQQHARWSATTAPGGQTSRARRRGCPWKLASRSSCRARAGARRGRVPGREVVSGRES